MFPYVFLSVRLEVLTPFTPVPLPLTPPPQASFDPLLVSSLYASVAGLPRLDSVRLPVGCRGESLCGFLDQNASMLVKKNTIKTTSFTRLSFFPSFLYTGETCETPDSYLNILLGGFVPPGGR